jgi:hypothetical protein
MVAELRNGTCGTPSTFLSLSLELARFHFLTKTFFSELKREMRVCGVVYELKWNENERKSNIAEYTEVFTLLFPLVYYKV